MAGYKNSTLIYIEKDNCYLMLHRIKKKNDVNKDKWIGIGGHFEDRESPDDCVIREVMEETGLTLTDYKLRAVVTFICDEYPTEYMFLYTATGFTGTMNEDCNEGVLEWVPKDKLNELNLWEGDYIFLDLLDKGNDFFTLKLVYDGDKLISHEMGK